MNMKPIAEEKHWIDQDNQDELEELHRYTTSVKLNRYTLMYNHPEYEQYFRRYYVEATVPSLIHGIAEFIVFFILW